MADDLATCLSNLYRNDDILATYLSNLYRNKEQLKERSLRELCDFRDNLSCLVDENADANIYKRVFANGTIFMVGTCLGFAFTPYSDTKLGDFILVNALNLGWRFCIIRKVKNNHQRISLIKYGRKMLILLNYLINDKLKNWNYEEEEKNRIYQEEKEFFEQFGVKIVLLEKKLRLAVDKDTYLNMVNQAVLKYKSEEDKAEASKDLAKSLATISDLADKARYFEAEKDWLINTL